MNAIARTPKRTKRATIRPLSQGYLIPPHCIANSRQIEAGPIKIRPRGSNSFNLPNQVFAGLSGAGRFGVKKTRKNNDIPPMGTLIQKQHRHVAAVRYPPRIGPRIDDSPNTEPSPPVHLGLSCNGTRRLISKKTPVPMPAPPIPVMARPTIKALELGAEAQTMDPISKMATRVISNHLVE